MKFFGLVIVQKLFWNPQLSCANISQQFINLSQTYRLWRHDDKTTMVTTLPFWYLIFWWFFTFLSNWIVIYLSMDYNYWKIINFVNLCIPYSFYEVGCILVYWGRHHVIWRNLNRFYWVLIFFFKNFAPVMAGTSLAVPNFFQ